MHIYSHTHTHTHTQIYMYETLVVSWLSSKEMNTAIRVKILNKDVSISHNLSK